jgi:hypothetical protein
MTASRTPQVAQSKTAASIQREHLMVGIPTPDSIREGLT